MNDENLVRWFLAQSADPNASSEACDITPLPYAVQKAPFAVIQLFFQHGGSTAQGQLLNMASDRTDPDSVAILQFLFDRGDTRINDTYLASRPEVNSRGCFKNAAPLHHAARVGNIDTVRWLLQHGANPWQRTVVSIGYGTTPIDSASYDDHTDIVDLLLEAIKEAPETPEPILPKPRTGIKIVDEANEHYYKSTIQGVRRDINHGNGDRQRGAGVMDYSFELMLLALMEEGQDSKTHKQPSECGKYSDKCDKEGQVEIEEELQVKLMLQEQQEKKRQLMLRHEKSTLHGSDNDESTPFRLENFLHRDINQNLGLPQSSTSVDDSNEKKPINHRIPPMSRLSSRF